MWLMENNLRRIMNIDKIGCIRYTVTWRCNSRCKSCNIWKKKITESDLTPKEIMKLGKSPLLKDVRRIVLSGGEPILRNDFPELVSALHKSFPKAKFSMTTNGLLVEKTYRMIKEIVDKNPKIIIEHVGISLNGPREVHDETRGVPGSFDKAIETYHKIKHIVPVKFSFTYFEDNLDLFEWVQKFAKELGTEAYHCWTVMNDRFDTQDEHWEFFEEEIKPHLIEYLNKRDWFHRVLMSYLYDNFLKKKFMQCYAARQFFHLCPNGDIYPCNFDMDKSRLMGNIREKPLEEIWETKIRKRILKEIDSGKCIYQNGPCGDSDLTYSNLNNLFTVFGWYLKKKLTFKKLIE